MTGPTSIIHWRDARTDAPPTSRVGLLGVVDLREGVREVWDVNYSPSMGFSTVRMRRLEYIPVVLWAEWPEAPK